jgi:hypothetical protein
MSTPIAIIAFLVIIALLLLDVFAILAQLPAKEDLLRLSELLLSWQVVGGSLAVGGAVTFQSEIRARIGRPMT